MSFERNLARGYGVGSGGAVVPQPYPSLFSPAAGLLSSTRDMIAYSNAIDSDRLVSPGTKAQMFTSARNNVGEPIPSGLGWFVQSFEGTQLVWHFGFWTANSSLIVKAPDRGLTFVALANSEGLSRDFSLANGDVRVSPLAAEFLAAFVTGNTPLPERPSSLNVPSAE
jgi:CubicO group peptidase (beta-lactamase class C family)